MRRIAQYVAGRSDWSFDVIVHVGAGLGAELASYQRMGVRRTVLVEANPELAALLRQRSGGMACVEVRAMALAQRDGEAQLQVFNNARESSLYPPTRLLQLFPNLSPAGSAQVPTISLERLLREAAADPSTGNLLVLDVAAISLAALDGCALDVLHDFSHIAVLTAALPLYAGTAGEPELRGWLEQSGYRQHFEDDHTVAPYRELLFVRDDAAVGRLRLARAAADVLALRATCAAQAEELRALRSAAEDAHEAHARLLRMRALAASLLSRTGVAASPAQPDAPGTPDAPHALEAEAFLSHCIDSVVDAWDGHARARARARELAEADQRALQELAAESDARAGREHALRIELEQAAAERAALAADVAHHAARGDQLGQEMVRAEAQIGLIRDLLLRETDC